MNARAQRAQQYKKIITSFGLTSQREITMQNRYNSNFNRQIAIYTKMPTLTVIKNIKMASNQNAPKRRIEVHTFQNVSSFGRDVKRATDLSLFAVQKWIQQSNFPDLADLAAKDKEKKQTERKKIKGPEEEKEEKEKR